MNFGNKNKTGTNRPSAFSRIEKVPPFVMMLYLGMLGIGVLFIILVFAYIQTQSYDNIARQLKFPKYFSISTVLILFSSYTISKLSRFYKKDNLQKLKSYLFYSILLGLAFVLSQVGGWYEIAKTGVSFTGLASGTYIYLISALHAVHLLGGFIFLSFLYFKTLHASRDSIRTLLYIRNPFVKQQLKMLTYYWHFMDCLWLFLYVVFLFTM